MWMIFRAVRVSVSMTIKKRVIKLCFIILRHFGVAKRIEKFCGAYHVLLDTNLLFDCLYCFFLGLYFVKYSCFNYCFYKYVYNWNRNTISN